MKFHNVWSLLILGLEITVSANSTQHLNVTVTDVMMNRRQADQMDLPPTPQEKSGVGHVNEAVKAAAKRFTVPTSTTRKFQRTTPRRISFKEDCDYLAHYCLKAYDTGVVCGRTIYYRYFTFKNYCLLDYVNCMERYEVWQIVHMGECFGVKELTEYILYPYEDDFFLDQYYIIEDI